MIPSRECVANARDVAKGGCVPASKDGKFILDTAAIFLEKTVPSMRTGLLILARLIAANG